MSQSHKKLPADGTVDSGMITDGTIVNADVNASAAIAYSKLDLGTSIVNADINASAAIVGSKIVAATDSAQGVVELATDAELNTGTATDRAVTPANIEAWTGGTSVVTLGTIATGVWQGTAIVGTYLDLSAPGIIGGSTPAAITGTTVRGTDFGNGGAHVVCSSAGEVTKPLQPCVLASPSADLDNVTGDATAYTIVWASEITDQNSDFDGTSTFTSPVTGNYKFDILVGMHDLAADQTKATLSLITSNRTYKLWAGNIGAIRRVGTNDAVIGGGIIADMDAADTATVTLTIENGSKVVDIEAATSFLSVQLIS